MYCGHVRARIYHITLDGNKTICGIRWKGWEWATTETDGWWRDFKRTLCSNCRRTSAYGQLTAEGSR